MERLDLDRVGTPGKIFVGGKVSWEEKKPYRSGLLSVRLPCLRRARALGVSPCDLTYGVLIWFRSPSARW